MKITKKQLKLLAIWALFIFLSNWALQGSILKAIIITCGALFIGLLGIGLIEKLLLSDLNH